MSHHPARIAFIAALLAASALGGACSRPAPRTVVLVTIDTLRADRLGCYGDAEAVTPVHDALARRGVRLTSASAPAPVTLPSHASIRTGRFPCSSFHDLSRHYE